MGRARKLPADITLRVGIRADGTRAETYMVRWREPDGRRPARTFDTLADAMDFQAKVRSAKRWRPDELRQEQGGRQTLEEFFEEWWTTHAVVELRPATQKTYRYLWNAHALPRLGKLALRDIDARRIVGFRAALLDAGVGTHSVIKTMTLVQRVFRDAVELGDVALNPVKMVQKPSAGPAREARPLTPLQVEQLAYDLDTRGYIDSAALVRLMAYTGVRPQEALALHWYAVRPRTLLVELANADGELDKLKNRKRARKRSRTIDLMEPVRSDLRVWRAEQQAPGLEELVFPYRGHGGLWGDEDYRRWRRHVFVPSAENVGLPTRRPYDLRHTWASLRIAEKKLTIVEISEQLGDKTSTVLDVYSHVINEWRDRRIVNIEAEIQRARKRVWGRLAA